MTILDCPFDVGIIYCKVFGLYILIEHCFLWCYGVDGLPIDDLQLLFILLCRLFLYLCDEWNSGLDLAGGSYSTTWLINVLLAKLARWSDQTHLNTEVTSLRLVGVERYGQVYNDLKNKYGKHFVEVFLPFYKW